MKEGIGGQGATTAYFLIYVEKNLFNSFPQVPPALFSAQLTVSYSL